MMTRQASLLTVLALLGVLIPLSLLHAAERHRCAECGMTVDETSRFSARFVSNGTTLSFCDIGDLLVHLREKKLPPAKAQVKDYLSGEGVSADAAYYVHAPKRFSTPMGWDVAAFRDKAQAETFGPSLDLAGMMEALK